jgi:sarcosine oxidase gamma subunit
MVLIGANTFTIFTHMFDIKAIMLYTGISMYKIIAFRSFTLKSIVIKVLYKTSRGSRASSAIPLRY